MDLATIVGVIAGLGLIVGAIALGGNSIRLFVDFPSMGIVFGGAIASCLVSLPLSRLLGSGRVLKKACFAKKYAPEKLIADLVSYAEIARRDGILSLESMTDQIEDKFIVKGIQMAVDGTDPELIEQILVSELDALAERHRAGKAVFDALGKYAPAFGMIGTLVGLIIMLNNMENAAQIGSGMAVAMITTFYGAVAANLVFLPIADKLATRSKEEILIKEIIIRGVMSIQSGDNPRIVEQKLKTFLPSRPEESQARSRAKAA